MRVCDSCGKGQVDWKDSPLNIISMKYLGDEDARAFDICGICEKDFVELTGDFFNHKEKDDE